MARFTITGVASFECVLLSMYKFGESVYSNSVGQTWVSWARLQKVDPNERRREDRVHSFKISVAGVTQSDAGAISRSELPSQLVGFKIEFFH